MKTLDFSGKQFYQQNNSFASNLQKEAQKHSSYTIKISQWQKK